MSVIARRPENGSPSPPTPAEAFRCVRLLLNRIHLLNPAIGDRPFTDCPYRGETVKLSAFGSLLVRNKGPRPGRNPKTGVPVPIPPQTAVVFKPSGMLRKRLAGGGGISD